MASQTRGTQLARERLQATRVLVVCALVLALARGYAESPLSDWVEQKIALPLYFNARAALGEAPPLHPKLKIYSYDDTTFAKLQSPYLKLEQWVTLLEAMAARNPRAIYIDQIFAMVPEHAGDPAEVGALLARLERIATPIITSAFVTPGAIGGREPLDLGRDLYQLRSYFNDQAAMLQRFPPFAERHGWRSYGPNPALRHAFRSVGHALNAGHGHALPVLSLGAREIFPHMAFLGGNLEINRGRLILDGVEVPLTARGEVLVDFSEPMAYHKGHRRILRLLEDAQAGRPLRGIEAEDLVLILPAMYTGHGDFTQTPVGDFPGGFVIATLLNSRLRGVWLVEQPSQGLVDTLAVGIGVGVTLATGAYVFPALALAICLWLAGAVWAFTSFGVVTGLSSSLLALTLASLTLLAVKNRLRERLLLIMKMLKSENEQLQQELTQVGEIARVLLPPEVPDWPELTIGAFHQSLTEASGDWYAFERSPSGGFLHFLLCDISGHGAQAAIVVSTCKTVLSMLVDTDPGALERADFLTRYANQLNRTLCRQGGGLHTTTFVGITLEPATGRLHCLCAAHPQPLHVGRDGARQIGKVNNLLGFSAANAFTAKTYDIAPGDSIVAFTDGVVFPRRLDKIRALLERYAHHAPDAAARYVALEGWEARTRDTGTAIDDDLSLVWIRFEAPKRRARGLKAS